jgi:WD40 repeat protein
MRMISLRSQTVLTIGLLLSFVLFPGCSNGPDGNSKSNDDSAIEKNIKVYSKPEFSIGSENVWVIPGSLSNDGKLIAGMIGEGSVKILTADKGEVVCEVEGLKGYPQMSPHCSFSADNKIFAAIAGSPIYDKSGSQLNFPNDICMWSAETGELKKVIPSGAGDIRRFEFSEDGSILCFLDKEKYGFNARIRIWSAKDGRFLRTIKLPENLEYPTKAHMIVSPNGKYLAVSTANISVWSTETGERRLTLSADRHSNPVWTFTRDSQILARSHGFGNIELHSVDDGKLLNTISFDKTDQGFTTHSINSIAFSSDGETIAVSGYPNGDYFDYSGITSLIKLFSVNDGYEIGEINAHHGYVAFLKFSSDNKKLISMGNDGVMNIWNLDNKNTTRSPENKKHELITESETKSDTKIGSNDDTNSIPMEPSDGFHGWEYETNGPSLITEKRNANSQFSWFSSDSKTAIIWCNPNTFMFCSPKTLDMSSETKHEVKDLRFIEQNKIGKEIYILHNSGDIDVFKAESNRKVNELNFVFAELKLHRMKLSPDMELFAAKRDKVIEIKYLKTGEIYKILDVKSDQLDPIMFSPDGQLLLIGRWDKPRELWDIKSASKLCTWDSSPGRSNAICFSQGGNTIVFSQGNELVWKSIKTCETVRTMNVSQNLNKTMFSRDEKFVAISDTDSKIYVYEVASGELKQTLWGHMDGIESMDFSPDGRRLLTTSQDGVTKLWSLDDLYR